MSETKQPEIDPAKMKLRIPIPIQVGVRSKIAGVVSPQVAQNAPPGATAVNFSIQQIEITTGAELTEFVQKVQAQEYIFPRPQVMPFALQLMMALANVVGFEMIEEVAE